MIKIAPKLFQSTCKNDEDVVFGLKLQACDIAYTGLHLKQIHKSKGKSLSVGSAGTTERMAHEFSSCQIDKHLQFCKCLLLAM
jgi:hypothetical protein